MDDYTRAPLRFELRRNETSAGFDVVARGVQFDDGTVVMRWDGDHPSTQLYADWGDLMRIHHVGEPGSSRWTTAFWFDGVCFTCGGDIRVNTAVYFGGNDAQCASCSASWSGPPSRVQEPEAGRWRSFEIPARTPPQPEPPQPDTAEGA